MDALISDCDGVIVDSEPIHLAGFQKILAEWGVTLTREAYYDRYLGFDDHDCFAAVGADNGRTFSEDEIAEMTAAKTTFVKQTFATSIGPQPGAAALIRAAANAAMPLAICSGGLRDEIMLAAQAIGVWEFFSVVVAAEDVECGKPDPEGYARAAEQLAAACGRGIAPEMCVVVEDAPAGIKAAKALGMKVLAVTSSYQADALVEAERVVDSLADVTLASLAVLL